MEVGEEQEGAALMGSGLCMETQAEIPSGRENERWIERFLGEMEVRTVHLWCIITCLEISVRGICSYHVREGIDNTFKNNCRAFH